MDPLRAWLTLRRLERNLALRPDQLRALQFRKLEALVRHAYASVPYYRRLFDEAKFRPDDLRSLDDLKRIPITRKAAIQHLPLSDRMVADVRLEDTVVLRTTGSTGRPLEIRLTIAERDYHALLTLRSERLFGLHLTDHVAIVTPSLQATSIKPRWFERLGFLRKSYIEMCTPLAEQLDRLARIRPDVVISHASYLAVLGERLSQTGSGDWRPRLLFGHSDGISEGQRQVAEAGFGAPLFSRYDAWETHLIAWECERHDGMHIDADHVLIECLRGDSTVAVDAGEVVVTNLDARAMPFLRYALDDVAELNSVPCVCGRSLPRLRAVHGRVSDMVHLPGDRVLRLMAAGEVLNQLRGVSEFRLVQEEPESFRLEVVAGPGFSPPQVDEMLEIFRQRCGGTVKVRHVLVDSIVADPSGKRRTFVSEIADRA